MKFYTPHILPISLLLIFQFGLFAQWSSNGFVIEDPSGPTPAGFTESGNCLTSGTTSNYVGITYKDANVNLTTAGSGFSFTFDLNFGTNTGAGIGDGFAFLIKKGVAFGGDGGQLGYTNTTSDYLAFEWDSYANSTTVVYDPAGYPAQHLDINGYNGAAQDLVAAVTMGAEVRNTGAHRASITWAPDGSGGGTFTQTLMNGTLKTLSVTFTAAQLSAYDWATAADFNFIASTNNGVPQTQTACWVDTALPIDMSQLSTLKTNTDTNGQMPIYPNPANDKLTISTINCSDIKFYTLHGQAIEISSTPISDAETSLDVSVLKEGFYLINYVENKERKSSTLLIAH